MIEFFFFDEILHQIFFKKADTHCKIARDGKWRGDTQQMVGGRHKEEMAHVKVSELPSGSIPTKEKEHTKMTIIKY